MEFSGVVFDFYDTLCRVDEKIFVSGRRQVAEAVNISFDTFYAAWKKFGRKNITGELLTTQDRMAAVLTSLEVEENENAISEYTAICDNAFLRAAEPYPETFETISSLKKKGIPLHILSNASQNAQLIARKLEPILKQFDSVYFSYAHGLAKPDIEFYKLLIKEQNIDPGKFLYCGDGNDRELDVATSLGFTSVKVDHEVMASYRFGESTDFEHTIRDLTGILKFF